MAGGGLAAGVGVGSTAAATRRLAGATDRRTAVQGWELVLELWTLVDRGMRRVMVVVVVRLVDSAP